MVLAGLLVLALIGGAVWFFALRDDEPSPPDLTESQLDDALLTAEDLGGDYTEQPDEDDSDELSPDDLDTSDECKDLIKAFEGDDAAETQAKREFSSGSEGETFTHEVAVPSEDSPDFGVLGDVVDSCAEIGIDQDDVVGTMQITEGDSPSIGDRAFTMDVEFEIAEPMSVQITSQVILWERDGLISSVQANGAPDSGPDTDLLREMAELADERLIEVIEDAG